MLLFGGLWISLWLPVGAKSCSDLTDKGKISSAEGEYLLSFCKNVSPAFLTGYVAVQSLKQPEMAQICLRFSYPLPHCAAPFCSADGICREILLWS